MIVAQCIIRHTLERFKGVADDAARTEDGMPPSIAPLLPSPGVLEEAASVAKKVALLSSAIAASFYAAPRAPKTTAALSHLFLGFTVKPGGGIVVKPSFGMWVAPQPIGVVPPRMYGIPQEMGEPKFYARIFGAFGGREAAATEYKARISSEHQRELDLYRSNAQRFSDAVIQQRVDELRRQPFHGMAARPTALTDIEQAGVLIAEQNTRAIFRGEQPPPYLPPTPPPTTEETIQREANVAVIGAATYQTAVNFLSIFGGSGVPVGATATDPFAPTVPSASIQPEAIEAVNDAARRNAAVAKGIRRMLVSERADP